MIVLQCILFAVLSGGILLVLGYTPVSFVKSCFQLWSERRIPIAKHIQTVQHPRKPGYLQRLVTEARETLHAMGRAAEFERLCMIAAGMSVLGIVLAIVLHNVFIMPVLILICGSIPFWYLKYASHAFKKQIHADLEQTLSALTTSYLRNENIITTIEEHVHHLQPPFNHIFQGFLVEVKLITVNIRHSLTMMKPKLDHAIFHEWIDAVIACQDDKTLKSTLPPIVAKLSDMRLVTADLEHLMYQPLRDFMTMAVLVMASVPALYFINRDWFDVLINTLFGHIILTICAIIVFISVVAVLQLTKPLDYKR